MPESTAEACYVRLPRRSKITTAIYGTNYQLAADSEPEYLEKLARTVDERMNAAAQANPHLGPMRVALLAVLELAAEVKALEQAVEKQQHNLTSRCHEIERDIERLLGVA